MGKQLVCSLPVFSALSGMCAALSIVCCSPKPCAVTVCTIRLSKHSDCRCWLRASLLFLAFATLQMVLPHWSAT